MPKSVLNSCELMAGNGVKESALPRCWNVAVLENGVAEITFYGDILPETPYNWWTGEPREGQYITPETFAEDLKNVKNAAYINIKINSCGGDVYTALAIHNALKSLPGHKTVIIEGIAASAASVLAMAGDEVKMFPGSLMMIHGVSMLIVDYLGLSEIDKLQQCMDASERAISEIYAAKTGESAQKMRELMTVETWMTCNEAKEKGFCDSIITETKEPKMGLTNNGHMLIVNGVRHNVSNMAIPARFNIPQLATEPAVAPAIKLNAKTKGAQRNMTKEELRQQFPELVNEITQEAVQAAVAAERVRIQEIEEIEVSVGDSDMLHNAKFVKPINAAELALAAMKKQAKNGSAFLAARADEQKTSNAVAAARADDVNIESLQAAEKAEEKAKIAELSAKYKEIFKK